MKVLVYDTNGWHVVEGDGSLQFLQDLLGGVIEPWPSAFYPPGVELDYELLVNAEGRHSQPVLAEFNSFEVHGPLCFVGPTNGSGDYTQISEDAMVKAIMTVWAVGYQGGHDARGWDRLKDNVRKC